MKIDLIGFDADDTLWHTEIYYIKAQQSLEQLLGAWGSPDKIGKLLFEIEIDNLPRYGYGIKAFVLSMIEAAIRISGGQIHGDQIEQILKIGRTMLDTEVILRPHVAETLKNLSPSYRLMILTKGDLLDQTAKVNRSGIAHHFSVVEVVNDKNPETYTKILDKHHVNPQNFLMIGNTVRSDIHPVLALGGTAVHIPADSTWEHEVVPGFDTSQNSYYQLEHMGQLTDLIAKISHAF